MNGVNKVALAPVSPDKCDVCEDTYQLVYKQKVALSFDNAASQYSRLATIQGEIADYGLMLLASKSEKKVSSLLDIGCGTANSFTRLQSLAHRVTGVDISLKMLRQASTSNSMRENGRYGYINGDAEYLPIQSNSIDTVYSSMAMQWCQSPEQVLAQVYRVLKPKGTALLCILTGESFGDLQRGWQHIGLASRVNSFHSQQSWTNASQKFKWSINSHSKRFTSRHVNVLDMLGSIKRIGANTKFTDSSGNNRSVNETNTHNYMGKEEIKALSRYLKACNAQNDLLSLEYHLVFLEIKK